MPPSYTHLLALRSASVACDLIPYPLLLLRNKATCSSTPCARPAELTELKEKGDGCDAAPVGPSLSFRRGTEGEVAGRGGRSEREEMCVRGLHECPGGAGGETCLSGGESRISGAESRPSGVEARSPAGKPPFRRPKGRFSTPNAGFSASNPGFRRRNPGFWHRNSCFYGGSSVFSDGIPVFRAGRAAAAAESRVSADECRV